MHAPRTWGFNMPLSISGPSLSRFGTAQQIVDQERKGLAAIPLDQPHNSQGSPGFHHNPLTAAARPKFVQTTGQYVVAESGNVDRCDWLRYET